MENVFFEALKRKLRFNINGNVSTEDLFSASYTALARLEEELTTKLDSLGKSRRGTSRSEERELVKLQLDVVTAILDYKDQQRLLAENERADKEHNQKIMELIKQKQDEELSNLSVAELQKLLKQ